MSELVEAVLGVEWVAAACRFLQGWHEQTPTPPASSFIRGAYVLYSIEPPCTSRRGLSFSGFWLFGSVFRPGLCKQLRFRRRCRFGFFDRQLGFRFFLFEKSGQFGESVERCLPGFFFGREVRERFRLARRSRSLRRRLNRSRLLRRRASRPFSLWGRGRTRQSAGNPPEAATALPRPARWKPGRSLRGGPVGSSSRGWNCGRSPAGSAAALEVLA